MLHAVGRLNPYTYDADRSLRGLGGRRALWRPRGRAPGAGAGTQGCLPWHRPRGPGGHLGRGSTSWFDPLTAIRGVALAPPVIPRIKLFFMGVKHP